MMHKQDKKGDVPPQKQSEWSNMCPVLDLCIFHFSISYYLSRFRQFLPLFFTVHGMSMSCSQLFFISDTYITVQMTVLNKGQ